MTTPPPAVASPPYDAVLVVSFGGPEGPDDVMPFLENVLRGKNVPRERMLEVAEHYHHFGGVSPINAQNRALIAALGERLERDGPRLPIYWGNRNWRPMLADTLAEMARDGVRRALAFVTSAASSYSGCRQYREDIERAREAVGPTAPVVDKLRVFFNHPGFIEANVDHARAALGQLDPDLRAGALLLFTAHSIPVGMADNCRYEAQLRESSRLVAERLGHADWRLVFQSRSGPPQQPWLEPDVCDAIRAWDAQGGTKSLVIQPIGFDSDHLEVLYDLDTEAKGLCDELGVVLQRGATPGTHPAFVGMVRDLIAERLTPGAERPALGPMGPSHDVCPQDCCLYTPRRPGPPAGANP